jgi:hypothetical protein
MYGTRHVEDSIIAKSKCFLSVVMVYKKDSPCHMFPNYKEVNKVTIKDKFLILVIDELHGAVFFMKLDLCLGYHQIRMREKYIPPKKFRIDKGHYDLLVMPCGLTNAPSTFQS